MRLYILRHGQTKLNSEKRFQGRMQTELNEIGIAQAQKLGSIMKDRGIIFDKIYCSPLERAIRTGEIATGIGRDEFVIDDSLVEIDFGANEGRRYDELNGTAGNIFLSPETYIPPEGGESLQELSDRTKKFLDCMAQEKGSKNVLAVSHGTTIHMMLLHMRDMDISCLWSERVGNCNVTVVDIADGNLIVRDDLQIATDEYIK